jgi:hypothetical protein
MAKTHWDPSRGGKVPLTASTRGQLIHAAWEHIKKKREKDLADAPLMLAEIGAPAWRPEVE